MPLDKLQHDPPLVRRQVDLPVHSHGFPSHGLVKRRRVRDEVARRRQAVLGRRQAVVVCRSHSVVGIS